MSDERWPEGRCDECGQEKLDGCTIDGEGASQYGVVDGSMCPNWAAMRDAVLRRAEMNNHDKRIESQWEIAGRYETANLSNVPSAGLSAAKARHMQSFQSKGKKYIDSIKASDGRTGPNLLITGGLGSGKTWLGCAAINYATALDLRTMRCGVAALLDAVRDTINNPEGDMWEAESEQAIVKVATATEILMLDDYGMHSDTEFAQRLVYAIVNARYEARRPIIVTTNLDINQLAPNHAWDRVARRLREDDSIVFDMGDEMVRPMVGGKR